VLTEANLAAVAGICRRLDELPLAIELAAARSNALPPPAVLARLDNRLSLLTTGARDRDQPERLQTMVQAISWSYDLLSDSERSLFRRLAVFAGGCTFHAAEAVAADPGIDVLQELTFLVDKSLLRQVPGEDEEPRLVMLETVREFLG
jgi:predicted ATPase